MKDRLIGFLKTYCLFICIFALQKPFFHALLPFLVRGRFVDGVVGCDVAWTAVGLIACRLSDCCSWIALYLFCLDGIQSSSPYMVRLFCFRFGFRSPLYLPSIWDYTNTGDSGWTLRLCSISFLRQRCGGKCQYMGG